MHWALIEDSRHESVHPRESAWKWAPLKICADFSCMSQAGLVACCIYAELHIKGWCCRVSHSHPPASNWDLLITHLAENSAFDAMYKIAKHCTAGHTRHPDERCKYKGHYLWAWLFPICMFTFLHVQYNISTTISAAFAFGGCPWALVPWSNWWRYKSNLTAWE